MSLVMMMMIHTLVDMSKIINDNVIATRYRWG